MSRFATQLVGNRGEMSGDAADERHQETLRYLAALAHAEAEAEAPPKAPGVAAPNAPPKAASGVAFVRDVMVVGVVAAHQDAVFKEIVAALVRNRVSAVPVVDADRRVVGVVSESDLLVRVAGGPLAHPRGRLFARRPQDSDKTHAATARALMTSPPVVTSPDVVIADAARKAADARVRRLPVVDADGVLIGIVSRADLLRPFLRPDDEIREDVLRNVIVGAFVLNPQDFVVHVEEGVVRLRGQVEGNVVLRTLIESVRAVAGVVDVDHNALTSRLDDAPAFAAALHVFKHFKPLGG